ncbi:DUF5327 family protein [Gracilibacillus marinus]|uniref:DUF5327 family protein n=1 Tax=Gracilibacillus marinus TaxID=630535 RepID=A0ABV8VPT3_9BACI
MAISNQQILSRIMKECEQAIQSGHVREHAKAIQVLADLLLDSEEKSPKAIDQQVTASEWKAMIGNNTSIKNFQKEEDDEGNGGSLLDF